MSFRSPYLVALTLGVLGVVSGCGADEGRSEADQTGSGSTMNGTGGDGTGATASTGGDLGTGANMGSGASVGTGAVGSTGGAVGTGGEVGTGGGATVECTPGTGTENVGTSSLLDKKTCLLWEKASSFSGTHPSGAKHCADLVQDGFDDWRMATAQELQSWPNLTAAGQFVTGPSYAETGDLDDLQFACTQKSHTCNFVWWDAGSAKSCAWQGQATQGPVICVRGTAAGGTLDANFAPDTCGNCNPTGYQSVDCSPYGT